MSNAKYGKNSALP